MNTFFASLSAFVFAIMLFAVSGAQACVLSFKVQSAPRLCKQFYKAGNTCCEKYVSQRDGQCIRLDTLRIACPAGFKTTSSLLAIMQAHGRGMATLAY
jgi:hypothetical protein